MTDEVLVDLSVSRDDVRRWQKNGWISFDVDSENELDLPYSWEIEFVRNLARSGLSDPQVSRFLTDLPKPYRFKPETVAYHLIYGWVCPCQDDPDDVISENLDDWLSSLAESRQLGRLQTLRDRIDELLENLGEEDETSEE